MYNLVKKDLKLGIQPIMFVLPFLLGLLMFIPSWVYFIIPMYFFWISVPNMFGNYRTHNDLMFTTIMPVTKQDMVKARVSAIVILEVMHIGAAMIFGLVANLIYSNLDIKYYFFAPTMGFWGLCMVMLAIFNIIFIPMFYKTAYKFGGALTLSTITAMLFAGITQWIGIQNAFVKNLFNGTGADNLVLQLSILLVGIVIFLGLTVMASKIAMKRFKKVDI